MGEQEQEEKERKEVDYAIKDFPIYYLNSSRSLLFD